MIIKLFIQTNLFLNLLFYRQGSYESASEIFGTQNIKRMMRRAPEENKHMLATSILREGDAWTNDSMRGGFGEIQKLLWQIKLREDYLRKLKQEIKDKKEETKLHL